MPLSDQSIVVLIADDDPTTRILARASVESAGFQVLEAADGTQAMGIYHEQRPDFVLLDVEMPGKNGFEVCRDIRGLPSGQRVPVIIITGHDDVDSINAAYEAGATAFVNKPINWFVLQHQIRYVLRASRTQEELHRSEAQVHYLAFHDNMTGLANRAFLKDALAHAIPVARRSGKNGAVLYINIDRFKRINDSLGYSQGDVLLREVATRLRNYLRDADTLTQPVSESDATRDTLGRLGGDEFVILLHDLRSQEVAGKIAERILEALSKPAHVAGQEIRLTASIGIAVYPTDGDNTESLLRSAEAAMVAAKQGGGNTYRQYQEGMTSNQREWLQLENQLSDGIARDELVLYYQPRVNAADGGLVGGEALVRWRHPERGLLPPGAFVPMAEENGLVVPLGDWVLREACRQVGVWRAAGLKAGRIGVNVSPRQFWLPGFVEKLEQTLQELRVPPESIELELTENTLIRDMDDTLPILHRLRDLGFNLAIDDFGTGWSSLSYLAQLPITTLKVDRSFVSRMTAERSSEAIVNLVVGVGLKLGLELVAEGVELEAQRDMLVGMQCHHIQGYLFGKPMPAEDFEKLLQAAQV